MKLDEVIKIRIHDPIWSIIKQEEDNKFSLSRVVSILRAHIEKFQLTDNPRGAIANFVVLGLAELHHEFGDVVLHVHLLHDRRPIVRDRHIAIGGDLKMQNAMRLENLSDF